jgi:cytochrome c oxidase assembly protein subunit 11
MPDPRPDTRQRTRPNSRPNSRSNTRLAIVLAAVCGVMVGASFAAVPFYSWFCKVTGFGGTTNVATGAAPEVLDRRRSGR